MRVGYRHTAKVQDEGGAAEYEENRGIFEATARTQPIGAGVEYIGRFRWDLRDVNGERYQLGVEIELNAKWRLEPSYYRQNDDRSEPSRINAPGLVLKYFH